MSTSSSPADASTESWTKRWQHWIAAVSSALLHVLFLILALLSPPVTVTPPQGAAAGSRMAVDFIGETPPPVSKAPARKPAAKRASTSPVQSTAVTHAEDPVPPNVADDPEEGQAEIPAATPPAAPPAAPSTPQRRPRVWGQPPGMLPDDMAAENAGLARSPATQRGRGNDATAGQPSMEVGGYQVYYGLRSETRLRAWRDQGMTEL
ncbi:MAG: type II toxin-antitoxin system RelE/ParE family toxin, partial [Pseudoxanthomonas sp.]